MTLRLKINLIVGALTLFFLAAVVALQLRGLRESVHEEVVAANRVAAQLLNHTVVRYAPHGAPAIQAFLQGLGRVRANDITLFDEQGGEVYRSPPSPYKAGRDAPAWFEALIAPPVAAQTIEFPGGRMTVRANASRAALDAWDDVSRLAGGSLLMALLINGLVFWLVGRAVRPLAQIADALDQLQPGRFDVALPPLPGHEAARIGAAFNRMVAQLQAHIDTERRAVRAETQLSDNRELAHWVDQQIEQERRMIARELHDEFGQSVTAMRSMALSIGQRVAVLDAQSAQAARVIAEESSRLYSAMHGIIPRLTPLALDTLGLAAALTELVERTRRSHTGVRVDLQLELGDAALPAEAALALYRAAQEGITNALRHGQATRLRLAVKAAAQQVELELQDNGSGLPSGGLPHSGHYGLRWLRERLHALRGGLQLAPATPQGVVLRATVPLGGATP